MFRLIRERIGVRVAFYVNNLLTVIMILGSIYLITEQSRSLEEQFLSKGRIQSIIGAKAVARILEEAIDNGVFVIDEIMDTQYDQIPGFDPPKYHTKYDAYMDKAILSLEDEFLKDKNVVFAVAVDINGYLPTHNTVFQKPITGDPKKDLIGNRTKRIFNDTVGIKAAQNLHDGFLQIYYRDTAEIMWDISSPIYVKGKHWGGFRIGYSLDAFNQAKKRLMLYLIGIMFTILIVSTFAIFLLINRALKPLSDFTERAAALADGEVDQKIHANTDDEIGKIADVLERLRISLKTAMNRLRRK